MQRERDRETVRTRTSSTRRNGEWPEERELSIIYRRILFLFMLLSRYCRPHYRYHNNSTAGSAGSAPPRMHASATSHFTTSDVELVSLWTLNRAVPSPDTASGDQHTIRVHHKIYSTTTVVVHQKYDVLYRAVQASKLPVYPKFQSAVWK